MLFWLLVSLLVVLGGAAAAGSIYAVSEKRRRALPAGATHALPAGSVGSDRLVERSIRDLRVGDVVTIDARDFLCEGVVSYDEDGHRWSGARIVDGRETRWCVVGMERTGGGAVRLLTQDDASDVAGYPPEVLVLADGKYTLEKRGTATCKLSGDVGALGGGKPGRSDSTVERCRWWLYGAPGDATAIVEQWGSDYRVLRGKKVSADTIDLIPGS
jgi:hypothetical protein